MIKRLFIILACLGMLGIVGTIENTYTRDVEVIAIHGTEVRVADNHQRVWEFEGEGYQEGDEITVVMHTNFTTSIYDDKIIDVK